MTGNGHMFYLILRDLEERTDFIAHMRRHGVSCPFHYVPLHSAPAGLRLARAAGDMSVTDDISARLVRLPMFYELGNDIEAVIEAANRFLSPATRPRVVRQPMPIGAIRPMGRAGFPATMLKSSTS